MFGTGSDNTSKKYKLYQGLENFKVLAVNPTLEEIQALGFRRDEEPQYVSEVTETNDAGETVTARSTKVDFYLDNDPEDVSNRIRGVISFFVNELPIQYASGKTAYINKYGQTAALENMENIPENMQWFNLEGARPAYQNEGFLIDFLRNLLNMKQQDPSIIEDTEAFFSGDISMFRKAVEALPNNKVRVLCGVKSVEQEDGSTRRYQAFYVRGFLRPYAVPTHPSFTYFQKGVIGYKEAGGAPSVDYGDLNDMTLREYSENTTKADSTQEVSENTNTWE